MNLYDEALRMMDSIVSWRRFFHENAEIEFRLPRTLSKVKEVLTAFGIRHRNCSPSGVMGIIGPVGARSILLRADMDALPMREESGLSFASKGKAVHACGHDMHTSMLLGAATLLKQYETRLTGRVILMFQPDEEGLSGSEAMIQDGLLKEAPERAVAMHVTTTNVGTGQILLRYDTIMTSCDRFAVTVRGKSGHGSRPDNAVNPIYAATKIIDAFTDICRYEISPFSPSALTICVLNAGDASNVIPNECKFKGTLRTLDETERERTLGRMKQMVIGIAAAYRCDADLTIEKSVPSVKNNNPFVDEVHRWLTEAFGREHVLPIGRSISMGSEDFARISERVPSCYISIGSSPVTLEQYPTHHPKVIFDEDLLPLGAAVYAQTAISYLGSQ